MFLILFAVVLDPGLGPTRSLNCVTVTPHKSKLQRRLSFGRLTTLECVTVARYQKQCSVALVLELKRV